MWKKKNTFYIHVSTCKRTIISFLIRHMVIIQQEYSHYSAACYIVHSITFQYSFKLTKTFYVSKLTSQQCKILNQHYCTFSGLYH